MNTTLVLGATGGLGGAVALELARRREPVRIMVRDPDKAAQRFPDSRRVQIVKGDIFDEPTLTAAMREVDLVFFGVNFPYAMWEQDFPRATQAMINAAKAAGAAVIFPGNTWALGPASKTQYKDDAPNAPCCKKGVIRAEIERMLREAAEKSGGKLQVINVRLSDAFGPTIRNPIVERIFGAATMKDPIKFLGKMTAPHQWAYAPDYARAVLDIAPLRGKFPPYEVINFPGFTAPKQEQFLRMVAERAGRATLPIDCGWTMLKMKAFVSREAKELMDLQHLYDGGVLLEMGKFKKYAPAFKATPAELAIDETVVSFRKELEPAKVGDEDDEA